MQTDTTPNAAPAASSTPRGPDRGLAFFGSMFMGTMTLAWSSNLIAHPTVWIRGVGIAFAVVGALTLLGGITSGRRRPRSGTPRRAVRWTHGDSPRSHLTRGQFVVAMVLEIAGIAAVIAALTMGGRPDLAVPLIGLVVALHFAIFYLQTREPVHLATTGFGVLACVAALVTQAMGVLDRADAAAIVGGALAAITTFYGVSLIRLLRS